MRNIQKQSSFADIYEADYCRFSTDKYLLNELLWIPALSHIPRCQKWVTYISRLELIENSMINGKIAPW